MFQIKKGIANIWEYKFCVFLKNPTVTKMAFFVSLPLPSRMASTPIHVGNGSEKNGYIGNRLWCSYRDGNGNGKIEFFSPFHCRCCSSVNEPLYLLVLAQIRYLPYLDTDYCPGNVHPYTACRYQGRLDTPYNS